MHTTIHTYILHTNRHNTHIWIHAHKYIHTNIHTERYSHTQIHIQKGRQTNIHTEGHIHWKTDKHT